MSDVEHLQIEQLLQRLNSPLGAAECHGVLCGMLCLSDDPINGWLSECIELDDQAAPSAQDAAALHAFYTTTRASIANDDLSFQLLLPDDERALEARTLELARWCQGCLYGLGRGGFDEKNQGSDELRELLQDFAGIAQAEVGDDSNEALEQSYVELVEFVRVGVLLMHAELRPLPAATGATNNSLH